MKYAIIGSSGFIAPRHIKAIQDTGGEVVLTCDIVGEADFTDWVEMYHSPRFEEIDCVVVCTPNYLHSVMTREAVLLGKKVICEKPLALEGIKNLKGVTPILQLRYHPEIQGLKAHKASVRATMYRNEKYWNSWKGEAIKSGGILYNLGVHYIDLLTVLLGEPKKIIYKSVTDTIAFGSVDFERGNGKFNIRIVNSPDEQGRSIIVDGREINLSNQENLSYEDLHKHVYEDFIKGKGFTIKDAKVALDLIKELNE